MDDRKPKLSLLLLPAFFALLFMIFFWRELLAYLNYFVKSSLLIGSFLPFGWLSEEARVFISQQVAQWHTDAVRIAEAHLLGNCLIGVFTFIAMMLWVAQFVLPVQRKEDRLKAAGRLFRYLIGQHGPAIFVKEGKIAADRSEQKQKKRKRPGVALVDLKSAIVVETSLPVRGKMHDPNSEDELDAGVPVLTPLSFFRRKKRQRLEIEAHGPGLIFTARNQQVHSAVDLRKQVRMTASPQIDAYTRDGIKIKSTVSTVFSLSEEPDTIFVTYLGDLSEHNPENVRAVLTDKRVQERGESSEYVASLFKLDLEDAYEVLKSLETADDHSEIGSINRTHPVKFQPFPFDADRVIRASYYLPYTAQGKTAVAWDELPLMVAVEAFRNKIAQYTYDYMHMPDDPDNFPLKRIRQEFSFSLRSKGILKYQVVFRRDGQPINENQAWNMGDILASAPRTFKNPQVLRERGIKVILANFGEFTPPDQVREELIANWRARWEKEINSRLAHRDLEAARIRNRARVKAQQDTSSFVLSEVFSGMPFSEEALTVRVFQALETAATDLGEARLLPHDTINMLWSLYQWMVREEGKPDETGSSPEDNMPGGL